MAGEGTFSLARGQADSAVARTGDAVPIQMGEVHSVENTGAAPLELMVVGVARDMRKELEYTDAPAAAPRRN
jgi:mannose-6-phosphate isomerase-like protein (cupin superfamily)